VSALRLSCLRARCADLLRRATCTVLWWRVSPVDWPHSKRTLALVSLHWLSAMTTHVPFLAFDDWRGAGKTVHAVLNTVRLLSFPSATDISPTHSCLFPDRPDLARHRSVHGDSLVPSLCSFASPRLTCCVRAPLAGTTSWECPTSSACTVSLRACIVARRLCLRRLLSRLNSRVLSCAAWVGAMSALLLLIQWLIGFTSFAYPKWCALALSHVAL
jgi:hypothetical protein